MVLRRLLHRMGYRYRLHRHDLPGTPDLTFPSSHIVVFVHGCFWHRHSGCRNAVLPATRRPFWEGKLSGNVVRDARNLVLLREAGWQAAVVWECELRLDPAAAAQRVATLLGRVVANASTKTKLPSPDRLA